MSWSSWALVFWRLGLGQACLLVGVSSGVSRYIHYLAAWQNHKEGGGVFVHPSICLSVHQPVRDAEVPDLQSLRSWHPAPGQQVGVHPHVIYVVERWTVSEMPRSQVCHPRRSTRAHTHMAQPLSRYRIVHLPARVPSSPFAASTLGSPPAPGNHWLCFVSL